VVSPFAAYDTIGQRVRDSSSRDDRPGAETLRRPAVVLNWFEDLTAHAATPSQRGHVGLP
jgi:hypothetical protein